MAAPQVPIDVNPDDGVWSTDGMPMLYVPRHFFINNHLAVEQALGREANARLLYEAGYRSAWSWCAKEAGTHGLGGFEVFRHYMRRISQRGWGQFSVLRLDEVAGAATVRVDHSTFVEAYRQGKTPTPPEAAPGGGEAPGDAVPGGGQAPGDAVPGGGQAAPGGFEAASDALPGGGLCYMFAGWFPGALTWAGENLGRKLELTSEEVQCGAEAGHDHCLFEIQ